MRVKVKLFATLREGRQKVIDMELPEDSTVQEIIDDLKIEKSEVAIMLINGRDGDFIRKLSDGDIIALFPPVGGG